MEQGAIVSHGESSLALGDNLEGWKGREAQEGGDIYIYIYIYYAKSLQSCPTLCDPMDCSLPGSSVHGIFQARVLEWGAIAFSDIYIVTTDSHCCMAKSNKTL